MVNIVISFFETFPSKLARPGFEPAETALSLSDFCETGTILVFLLSEITDHRQLTHL